MKRTISRIFLTRIDFTFSMFLNFQFYNFLSFNEILTLNSLMVLL